MKTLRRILTVSTLAVVGCAFASANTLVVNCSTASGPTELGNGGSGSTNSTINCTDWNTALGTLSRIDITLTGTVLSTSSVTGTNNDNAIHTGSVVTNENFLVDPASASSLANFGILNSSVDTTTFVAGMFNFAAGAPFTLAVDNNPQIPGPPIVIVPCSASGPGTCSQTASVTGTGSASGFTTTTFAPYQTLGAGTYSFIADTLTALVCNLGGGNTGCSQTTNASFTATVTYTYAPPSSVPEPTTLFLMGSALVGCGLLRKRIKS